ncbi:MAG: HAMP domain-containing protein [Planctomycetes bacterium]|nr:HAMP domain-containing protein [Planctomycetota bacterium]
MFQRLSTKLIAAVLAAVVVPFLGFAWFTDTQMAEKLSRKVVEQSLLGLVKELGGELDRLLGGCRQDLGLWSADRWCVWALQADERVMAPDHESGGVSSVGGFLGVADLSGAAGTAVADGASELVYLPDWNAETLHAIASGERISLGSSAKPHATAQFDRYVEFKRIYDHLLLIDRDGRLATCNSRDANGRVLPLPLLETLFSRDWSGEAWFQTALGGHDAVTDQHRPDWLGPPEPGSDLAAGYEIGFASPVRSDVDSEHVVGVLYALVNWRHVQEAVRFETIAQYFRGLVGEGEYPSAYGWIWALDTANNDARIVAHKRPELYGKKIAGDEIRLPQLVRDVYASDWALHVPYTFQDKPRSAAFQHCGGAYGFPWVVGVGIDDADIYAQSHRLRSLLVKSTLLVLLLVVLWTLVIARRTVRPILELKQHTERVAAGDLDARAPVRSRDEVGELAVAFNRMTSELKSSREQLIRAEKDAAWREMARQVAHDIKNPLTPIRLSLDLLDRSKRERPDEYPALLERTLAMMRRQVEHLREIAQDFYEFTGGRKPQLVTLSARELFEGALELHRAVAGEQRVETELSGDALLIGDRHKLERVLSNLLSNALFAMRGGGRLELTAREEGSRALLEIRDTGTGLSPEARAHLFEPYFTSKSEGTGLGLAIARRTLEELGGGIELIDRPAGEPNGTLARLWLPRGTRA